jgi:hypothetical protein
LKFSSTGNTHFHWKPTAICSSEVQLCTATYYRYIMCSETTLRAMHKVLFLYELVIIFCKVKFLSHLIKCYKCYKCLLVCNKEPSVKRFRLITEAWGSLQLLHYILTHSSI